MLEKVKYLSIRDICNTDIIFYEEAKSDYLATFCKHNSITYIPAKDRISCYKYVDGNFVHVPTLPPELICRPEDLIFEEQTINKFRQVNHDEVMFVVEDGLIKGVVHIVDYNNDDLYVELYRLILKFENLLRKLVLINGYQEDDIIDWIAYKASTATMDKEKKYYQSKYDLLTAPAGIAQRKNANPLQTFYLRDLLQFSLFKKLISAKQFNLTDITNIRNWIAHSKDLTTLHSNAEHPVYNINGLVQFIAMAKSFFKSYDTLEMLVQQDK